MTDIGRAAPPSVVALELGFGQSARRAPASVISIRHTLKVRSDAESRSSSY